MATTITIQAQIVRSLPLDGVFRVNVDIIDVTNIEFEVLVFTTEDSEFSHIATVFDMETYPAGQAAAAAANLTFFRDRGVEANFSTLRDATGFEQVTESRLKILAVATGTVINAFSGSEIITVDSLIPS